MQPLVDQMSRAVGGFLPTIIVAFVILVVGWLLALLISAGVRALLRRLKVDKLVADSAGMEEGKAPVKIDETVGKIVYYVILLVVLVAFFQVLGLTIITEPLNNLLNKLFEFAPQLLAAGGLLLAAWLIATILKFIISKALGAAKIDDRLASQVGFEEEGQMPLSQTLATVAYWIVFLLFLPAILSALGMQGLLEPVQNMIDQLLSYLPNVFGAVVLFIVGWLIARIVRQIVTGLLSAIGTDRLGERVGLSSDDNKQGLSSVLGSLVYVLILIPTIIAALNALQIEAISTPATTMLTTLLNALPAIFGAAVVLFVAYLVGRLVAGLVTNILTGLGFNRVLAWTGVGSEPLEGERTPSEIVAYLVLIGIMLFAVIEAAHLVGFTIMADLVAEVLAFGGQVLLGLVVFGLSLWLANLVRSVILSAGGENADLIAQIARIAVIVLGAAMGLRQMGIANDIVNLAFGLLLGALAVAAALAFGLGSREVAGREVEKWLSRLKDKEARKD